MSFFAIWDCILVYYNRKDQCKLLIMVSGQLSKHNNNATSGKVCFAALAAERFWRSCRQVSKNLQLKLVVQ